ncbi:cation:dicarboxylase symporter family transporter, partial [bacterium]|nr:cation:dicarboxylase symporter family transporter [bacterium]
MSEIKNRYADWLFVFMIIGIVLGVYCGWQFGEDMQKIEFVGDMFMNALRAIVVPLIMASMIVGVAGLGDIKKLGPIGSYTLIYYTITTSLSVLLGLILTSLIQPGAEIDIAAIADTPKEVQEITASQFSFLDTLTGMISPNIFESMAKHRPDVLPIIVASLIFGAALTTLSGRKREVVQDFFEGVSDVMMKIVHWIMFFAPIGVFALVAVILGEKGGGATVWQQLLQIGKYVMTVLLGLFIHAFVILPLILHFIGKQNFWTYGKNMINALTTAFSTASSAGTLPLTIECVTQKNKISNQSSSFVLPIGATINMDGTALYEAVAAVFLAEAYGIDLSLTSMFIIFFTATLASIGAAAIPHAGLFTMIIVLNALEIPLEGIGLIFTVDWFLDRCRTTVNVWGDSVGAAVIEQLA